MANLTYSLIYTPSTITNDIVKYTCSDGRIHIRFKNFNGPQVIQGFESKLTYLVSFIFHENHCNSIEEFMNLNDVWLLNQYLEQGLSKYTFTSYKYRGLKVFKNYDKQVNTDAFGVYNPSCFPHNLKEDNNHIEGNKIDFFIKNLHIIDLNEFLFNEGYRIIIHKKKETKDNKFIRKQKKIKEKESNLIELW